MTVRALVGLGLFNAFLLGVGVAALFALRGWSSWRELLRLTGLAYLIGVALMGTTLSLALVLGIPFSLATVLLTGITLVALAGVLRGLLAPWRPLARDEERSGLGLVAAVFGLMVAVYFEALFRASRLSALSSWDAWAFWVPKAKAIYFFGGLDEQFFRELPNPTYPPLLPALDAAAFHFMGSPDVVTLHVQFWLLALGFVLAVAGVLAPRVAPLVLWPSLLLVLVAPRIVGHTVDAQADLLLDYFFALAALLVAVWLLESEPWLLVTGALFMVAAVTTKREGQLLVVCILTAAFLASARQWRHAWPRLAAVAAVIVALAIPWKLWFSSRELTGELPSAGALALFHHLDRGWPALESALRALFDYDLWLLVVPLALAAALLAYVGGARILPTYALVLYATVLAGLTWVLWSFTELELPLTQDESVNPIVRLSGSLVVVSAAMLPLLLDAAWRGRPERTSAEQ